MEGISVVLPAYMEEENLKKILPQIHKVLENIQHEVIVVDTQTSMDNTEQVCTDNNCKYINRNGGNLYGNAIRTGITAASKEYIVIMDADGSHEANDIVRFYEEMKKGQVDLIIGSRYCQGGNTANPILLKLMSRTLNYIYRMVFKLRVSDVSDSFRMYKAEQLKKLDLKCDNFDIVEEILILLNIYNKDFKIKECPIFFHEREYGYSKRDLLAFAFSYLKTMHILLKRKHEVQKNNQ